MPSTAALQTQNPDHGTPARLALMALYKGRRSETWAFVGAFDTAAHQTATRGGERLPRFASRAEGEAFARREGLPPYAVWNPARLAYDGLEGAWVGAIDGYTFPAPEAR